MPIVRLFYSIILTIIYSHSSNHREVFLISNIGPVSMLHCVKLITKIIATFLTFLITFVYAVIAHANGSWEPITNAQSGKGAAVCNNAQENLICFGLRCKAGQRPEFVIFFTGGLFNQPVETRILVDGNPAYPLTFRPIKKNNELGAVFKPTDVNLLDLLKNGSQMTLVTPIKSHRFSLRGSSQHIQRTERLCGLAQLATTQTIAPKTTNINQNKWVFRPSSAQFSAASASVCSTSNQNHCFGYRCNIQSPQIYSFVSTNDPSSPRIETDVFYNIGDKRFTSKASVTGEAFEGIIEFAYEVDVSRSWQFLSALFSKPSVHITSDLFSPLHFSLNGASAAVSQLIGHCTQLQSNPAVISDSDNQPQTDLKKEPLPDAVNLNKIISREITEGCETSHGKIAPSGLTFKDLNNDGKEDLILSHHAISCTGGNLKRSLYCGAQVCTTKIFIRQQAELKFEIEFLGFVETISNDELPLLSLISHGGEKAKIRWNGKKIAVTN